MVSPWGDDVKQALHPCVHEHRQIDRFAALPYAYGCNPLPPWAIPRPIRGRDYDNTDSPQRIRCTPRQSTECMHLNAGGAEQSGGRIRSRKLNTVDQWGSNRGHGAVRHRHSLASVGSGNDVHGYTPRHANTRRASPAVHRHARAPSRNSKAQHAEACPPHVQAW